MKIRNILLAIGLAILSPVFLVVAVAGICAAGAVGLYLLITDHD